MSHRDSLSTCETDMDQEFAHARLFLKRDQRHAMSYSLMSFLKRAKAGPVSHASAEGRLEKANEESSKCKLLQSRVHTALTCEQERQMRLDRVEQWWIEVQQSTETMKVGKLS